MTERARSFERVASEYDRVRPSYPEALYDRIFAFGNLTAAAQVLEVGVGTGKATLPLAARGLRIVGIEPGVNLTAQARASLADFPNVTLITSTFENWDAPPGAFDLAFAAQAYHWLDPAERLSKFATTLKNGGVLAVFGHVPSVAPGALKEAFADIYARLAPELAQRDHARSWYFSADGPVMADLASSRDFSDGDFTELDWERSLDARDYETLLRTYSDHAALPADRFAALSTALAAAIHGHGGAVTLSYRTGLFLARRVPR
jgi:SAM-dependent methyltransferase